VHLPSESFFELALVPSVLDVTKQQGIKRLLGGLAGTIYPAILALQPARLSLYKLRASGLLQNGAG